MAVRKIVSLLIVAVLFAAGFAATSFSCVSAFDPVPHDAGPSGRKLLFESAAGSAEPRLTNMYFPSSFSAAISAAQQDREHLVDFTPGTFSEKPRSTPVPPVGPAPGTFEIKPRNTPGRPHGPAPGRETNWEVKTDQTASITIINVLGGEVSAHCHNGQGDVPNTVILPSLALTIDFFEEDIPWICDFSVVGGTATQSFPVWTHDGTPILSSCDQCIWEVQNDGFYIFDTIQGSYINVHSWNVNP